MGSVISGTSVNYPLIKRMKAGKNEAIAYLRSKGRNEITGGRRLRLSSKLQRCHEQS